MVETAESLGGGDATGAVTDNEVSEALQAELAARVALRQIAELTGKQPEGITGVGPAEGGWVVGIEVVEEQRIPSSSDILAACEAALDTDGELLSYRRVGRYPQRTGRPGDLIR